MERKEKETKKGTKAEKSEREGKDGAKREQESRWYERQLAWAGAY